MLFHTTYSDYFKRWECQRQKSCTCLTLHYKEVKVDPDLASVYNLSDQPGSGVHLSAALGSLCLPIHSLYTRHAFRCLGTSITLRKPLAARGGTRRGTESGGAPGWQGARNEHIRLRSLSGCDRLLKRRWGWAESGVRRTAVSGRYVSDEQRSQPGCSAARMQPKFRHGLPGRSGGREAS